MEKGLPKLGKGLYYLYIDLKIGSLVVCKSLCPDSSYLAGSNVMTIRTKDGPQLVIL